MHVFGAQFLLRVEACLEGLAYCVPKNGTMNTEYVAPSLSPFQWALSCWILQSIDDCSLRKLSTRATDYLVEREIYISITVSGTGESQALACRQIELIVHVGKSGFQVYQAQKQ